MGVVSAALSSDILMNDCYNLSFGKTLQIVDVAKRVCSAYQNLYSQELAVNIDLTNVPAAEYMVVDNSKLLSVIEYDFSDRLEAEAAAIMTMLKEVDDE